MRPSGKLHLGHYIGVLANWKKLQEENDCFFFAADWHALTTEYDNTGIIRESIDDMIIDWMASGIDPAKATLFIQSHVPEHAELHLLLSMITPLSWLERNPTYKEQLREITTRDLHTYGFLGYPVLQAADILMYDASLVPVGVDQLPHLELTREIARRFNFLYRESFVIPDAHLTETPKLMGLDNRKMSKSYGNAILLSDTADGGVGKGPAHGHRPRAPAAHRQGESGDLQRLFVPQDLFGRGHGREGRPRLPRPPGSAASSARNGCSRGWKRS